MKEYNQRGPFHLPVTLLIDKKGQLRLGLLAPRGK